jgi:hypothetical protein
MKNFVLISALLVSSAHAGGFDSLNNPATMGNYNYRFDSLPTSGNVDDAHMPWSDNYWESDWGGISLRWNTLTQEQLDPEGTETLDKFEQFRYTPPTREQVKAMSKEALTKLSPAEKYDILMSRYDYPTVTAERKRTSPTMEDWMGICHGWVPAAINNPEPAPTEATNKEGVVVPFGSTDVKALLSYYYGVPAYDYARGDRKLIRNGNTFQYLDALDGTDIKKWVSLATGSTVFNNGYSVNLETTGDAGRCKDPVFARPYGSEERCFASLTFGGTVETLNVVGQVGQRPSREGRMGGVSALTDPNPGAFHIVMANQLGIMHRSFVGNINKKLKNAQIWNQPITGFSTTVDSYRQGRRGGKVKVTTTLTYVSEIAQMWEPVVGTPKQRFEDMTFSYTLDLDESGRIVGGEWKDRSYHPSFIWKHDKIAIKGYMSKLNEIYHPRF